MQNKFKLGAATLALAAVVSGCAPVPVDNAQAGATANTDGAYGTTTGSTGATIDYGYGSYNTASNTAAQPANNNSYFSYGSGNTTAGGYGNASSGYTYDYTAPSSGSNSYGGGYASYSSGSATNSVSGRYAVQVVASSNRSTADAMVSQMSAMGFNAVVDNVGGMYKVRVPFSSESEAKSNLGRIRSSVPDAFYTVR
ncbi:MAG: SPOR domain-containing protein [Thiothrix sp.]